jgi:hypothetical protein
MNTHAGGWAVSGYSTGGAELNQALRWNGTKWPQVAPAPAARK